MVARSERINWLSAAHHVGIVHRDFKPRRDEKEQSPRSVYNKFEIVMTFLKAQGIRGLVGKSDWPRFVEEEPEVYEKEVRSLLDCQSAKETQFDNLALPGIECGEPIQSFIQLQQFV